MPATAQDATWLAVPPTNDINSGSNWAGGAVPTGVATFDQSTRTDLAIGGFFSFINIDTLAFNAGAPAYTIDTGLNFLTLGGLGVVNNSSHAPVFTVTGGLTFDNSAGAATSIINGDAGTTTSFIGSSTAANAVITMNGGLLQFTGTADGDNAQITVYDAGGFGRIDFSGTAGVGNNAVVHAGSLAGSGSISLGANQLVVGTNNLSTEVSGVIDGAGGSLTKVGTGTLTLSNANTYTGGTTVAGGTIVANHGDGTGAIDALGTGSVTLDGGKLLSAVNGALANDLSFADNKTSILAAAAGTTLTLGGAAGNTNTNFTVGNNAVLQFGTATDSGTIRFGASSLPPTINGSSSIVVAGGVLQDFQDSLATLLGNIASVRIEAGATLDYNDSVAFLVIANLTGAGSVKTGASGTNTLTIFSTIGSTNTFSGVISGSHPVSFSSIGGGPATVILSGDNTYTGGTTICACMTLQLGDGGTTGSVLGDIVNENKLIFNRSNTYTFKGVISDVGDVVQSGTGKTILTGVSTYTGKTTVDAGTLSINGDIRTSSGVIVNSGGTLGGTGFVPDTLVKAGGTLAPGNSVGTLNVVGNLQFITGSTYVVEVSSAGADRTNVSGTATLGGAAITASIASGTAVNKKYTIVNAAGGLTGRFNSSVVTTNLPSNFVTSLSYDANNAYLNFSLSYLPGSFGGLDQNQQNVGNALTNYFNSTSGIPLTFGLLTPGGLTQVSGEPSASIPTAGFAAMNQFINAMMDNSGGNSSQGGALGYAEENAYAPKRKLSPQQSEAYAAITPRDHLATPFASRWDVWATGYGGNSTINGAAATGSHATSTRVYGTAVGADYRATADTHIGFAAGGAGTNFTVDNALGGGRADVFQLGAYARHTTGAAYVTGAVAYAWQDVTTDRTVTVSGTDKLRAELKANALSARLEGGWRYAMLPFAVTPYVAAQSTAFYLPSYAENATSGSSQFALSYSSKTITATRGELGARFDKTMPLNDTLLTLRARTAWAHDWNDNRSATATFQSLPGASFAVNSAQPSANAALLSVGADVAWGNGWTAAATFDGEFSRTTRGYAGKGSLRYMW
jgi:autotransporter-associated beta strand protein